MIIDPLKEHTNEQIAALKPTAKEAMELVDYFNSNKDTISHDDRKICIANVVAVYRLVPREDIARYIDSVTSTKPATATMHPFKMQHELDTEA